MYGRAGSLAAASKGVVLPPLRVCVDFSAAGDEVSTWAESLCL
jgi:hypothetical protein